MPRRRIVTTCIRYVSPNRQTCPAINDRGRCPDGQARTPPAHNDRTHVWRFDRAIGIQHRQSLHETLNAFESARQVEHHLVMPFPIPGQGFRRPLDQFGQGQLETRPNPVCANP